jgi:hypothetical protein
MLHQRRGPPGKYYQALPGASFIVNGPTSAKNSALTSVGMELRLINGVSLLGKFDYEFAAHSRSKQRSALQRFVRPLSPAADKRSRDDLEMQIGGEPAGQLRCATVRRSITRLATLFIWFRRSRVCVT